jgi:amidase
LLPLSYPSHLHSHIPVLYEPALLQAAELDKHHAATNTLVGSLHGVPISVKDQFAVGHVEDNSIGMSRYCYSVLEGQEDGRKKEEEASLVRAIREAGGVVFCKTNVPYVTPLSSTSAEGCS